MSFIINSSIYIISKHTKNNTENISDFGLDNIKTTTLCRKCKNNCKNANIDKYIRIHDFRHSFASFCINKNVPIHLLSSYLGHENISTTLDIYSHLYPDSQEQMIQILQKQDQKQDQENVD